ncbi:DUF1430 domain-containing protein [Sinobaca sp. H24]|uniref:DUF1430 domain-containing protein n=1 Tax=Sinobaca sp. H24 TaxID=2923376 RepID=UPI00207AF968|nr:DUF1430 domain-containing protein [Sinobaca sp. H24]
MKNQWPYVSSYSLLAVGTLTGTLLLLAAGTMGLVFVVDGFISQGTLKGKLPFAHFHWGALGGKVILTTILFWVVATSLLQWHQLQEKVENLAYWNQSQDTYRTTLSSSTDAILNDLEKDRELNQRMLSFYQRMEIEEDAFLMESENYNVQGWNGVEREYFYEEYMSAEEARYSPDGERVTINANYLEINPIEGSNNQEVIHQMANDENTLTLLVPESYRKIEKDIKEHYLEYFYFLKVEVDNLYNEAIGSPLNTTSKEALSIQIIYTASEQAYFTFNSATGNAENQVIDPIAVIYNDSLDPSTITAYVSSSLYFQDDSEGEAFEQIRPLLEEEEITEIPAVASVYDEANQAIVQQTQRLLQQTIALIILGIVSTVLVSFMMWAYYKARAYDLLLMYLHGFSFWDRNKQLLLGILLSHGVAGGIVFAFFSMPILFPIILFSLLLEASIVAVLSQQLMHRNIQTVLKESMYDYIGSG